jgi:putative ABC transport system permease protein
MLGNALLTFYRITIRHPLYAALTLFGLGFGIPFEIDSASDSLDKYYKPDRDRSHLFNIGTAVAAPINCIGLYGLAAFSTTQRLREIGLRKVLGASRGAIVGLLIGQFLRPVVLASLIAAPIGYVVLRTWLTVGLLAWNAAGTEPGRALRQE